MSTLPSSIDEIRVAAPAKLNLLLEVIDRRADGYHAIESLLVPIDLCDEVVVRRADGPAGEIRLTTDDPTVPVDARNTAWRAVEEFYRKRRRRPALTITIGKRIPAGAGLGGGSSDAAAVLRALALLEGESAAPDALAALAARIGADVPFFLWCRPARVRGVGERVEPLGGFAQWWIAVAFPGFAISTAWAYAALDESLTWPRPADRMRRFLSGDRDLTEIHNDFEAVVGRTYPRIFELKQRLIELGARAASLTGSGSAVFGVFDSSAEAEAAARVIARHGTWTAAARTLDGPP